MWVRRRRQHLGKAMADAATQAEHSTAWWHALEAGRLPLEDLWTHLPDVAYALNLSTGYVLRVLLACLVSPSSNVDGQEK